MLVPIPAQYAIRALMHLAHKPEDYVGAAELVASGDFPAKYLPAILRQLKAAGLLTSAMGPRGGFRLAQDPAKITLRHVIDATGGLRGLDVCPFCAVPLRRQAKPSCLGHAAYAKVAETILAWMKDTTLQELSGGAP